jgi:hypothetical protein
MERSERLNHRLLYEVLGFLPVPFEPHGQAKEPVRVRQGFSLELRPYVFVGWCQLLRHQTSDEQSTVRVMS